MARQVVASDDPHRGRRIGKYEILSRLSVGGMAELFLAFTSGPGGFRKFVALKQILPDVKTDEFVKMFLDEARITAALTHANIGQVFELGQEDGELYLAMEFLAGQNLEQVMVAASYVRPVPPGFAARVVRDVCLGLHYAHHFTAPSGRKVAVVHRDLTPRNVMVTYDGVVKVIDFGIAKARGRIARTAVGMVKGTSGYMSPEQVRNHELDGRSDLFCAGVLLHEMLCGQRLFNTSNEDAMMRQIAEGDIPLPRTLNPEVPEALEAVVMRALERDPARRFATGKEMAKAIEAAVGPQLFDEDAVAELMQSLFAEKRLRTLALLEDASHEEERTGTINRAPQPKEKASENSVEEAGGTRVSPAPPPRQGAPRPSGHISRPPPPRRAVPGTESPSGPPAKPRSGAARMPETPPRKAVPAEEGGSLPASPPKPARPFPQMESREARRPPKMGVFTLGPVEQEKPPERDDSEDSETSLISRVSRVSWMRQGRAGARRRGIWITLALVVLAGLAVLFMPEPVRAALRPLMASAQQWLSERMSSPGPQAVPAQGSPTGPVKGTPSADAYEPPPPAEGSAEASAPAKATAPPRVKKPQPSTPAPNAPSSGTPTEAAAKKPEEAPSRVEQAPVPPDEEKSLAEPGTPSSEALPVESEASPVEPEAPPMEPVEPSTGPAEVDPGLKPLEETLPVEAEGAR